MALIARGNSKRRGRATGIDYDAPVARGIDFDDEGENLYADSVNAGHAIDPRAQRIFVLAVVLLVIYFVGLAMPSSVLNPSYRSSFGASGYTLSQFLNDFSANVNGVISVFTGNDTGPVSYTSKMIKYVVIAIAGAGLALCGAVYQGSFRNALVSPSTLGVMSGATLGMIVWVVFFVNDDGSNIVWLTSTDSFPTDLDPASYLASSYSLALLSLIGCVVVVAIVLLVMRVGGSQTNPLMLIITGQVIGGIMGAVANTIRYYYITVDEDGVKAQLMTNLQISSFYRVFTPIDILAIGIPLALTFGVVMHLRRRMNILAFSEGEARTMGVDTRKMRIEIVALCTILTAIIISFCGTVGFVGFLVPHLARRLVGPNFSYLLPATTVLGGVFVLGAYVLLEMTLGPSYETMVGMFISIGGAVVFLVTALSGKGGARGEFR